MDKERNTERVDNSNQAEAGVRLTGKELEESLLMESVRYGDTKAFDTLMRRYQRRVENIAAMILHSQEDAKDAMQETFMNVFSQAKNFNKGARFHTWLYSIVYNECRDMLRKRKNASLLRRAFFLNPSKRSPTPEGSMQKAQLLQSLIEALEQLPEKYHAPVTLSCLEGLSIGEISEVIGLPASTVKNRITRGREKLCIALGEDYVGDLDQALGEEHHDEAIKEELWREQ